MTDVILLPARMVTDPVLMLTLTPEGPEIVVMSVWAETKVDSVLPKLSVTALSRPLVTVATEEAPPVDGANDEPLVRAGDALSDATEEATPDEAEEPLSRVTLPPPRTEMTLLDAAEVTMTDEAAEITPDAAEEITPDEAEETTVDAADKTLLVGAGDMVADEAGDALEGEAEDPTTGSVGAAATAVEETLPKADERLESAEEPTEASGELRKALPSDVGAGLPFSPAKDPVGSPREMSDCDAHTDSGMLRGGYCEGGGDPDGQVVVVVEMVGRNGGVGAWVETTSVSYELIREDVMVSGQTVVETAVLSVTIATLLWRTGQLISHGGQPRMVTKEVSYAVEVETAGNRSTTTMLVRVL